MYKSNIHYGYQLENEKNAIRAGIIPYTVNNSRISFLFGIDRKSRDLTDFGGGIKDKETFVSGALREFNEETCNMFEKVVSLEAIRNSPAIVNNSRTMATFFVRVDICWMNLAEDSFKMCQKPLTDIRKHTELIGVKWIAEDCFRVIAYDKKNHCIWKMIQQLIANNTNWYDLRLALVLGNNITCPAVTRFNNLPSLPIFRNNLVFS